MCNDFGNRIPYSAYVDAFSHLKPPLIAPVPEAAPNLEPRDEIWRTDTAPVVRSIEGGVALAQVPWGAFARQAEGARGVAPIIARRRMTIATFNINDVNKRLANLLAWMEMARPDVVCLQELKSMDDGFPEAAIGRAGYRAVWRGQRSWNGVAILARGAEPVLTRRRLPGDPGDTQSRYIEAAVGGVLVACLYLPNGNPQPGPKFDYKLAWFERLIVHAAALHASGLPIVLAGDFNVVPTEADIYSSRSWTTNALLQPQAREAFARLLEQGWTDAIRARHPTQPVYTFWDYKRDRWPRDAGLRIDHLLLSPALRLTDAGVDRAVRGEPNASDHAPTWAAVDIAARPRRALGYRPSPV